MLTTNFLMLKLDFNTKMRTSFLDKDELTNMELSCFIYNEAKLRVSSILELGKP